MASRVQHLAIAGVFIGILCTPQAYADTITITSGSATLPWDDAGSYSLEAPGFVLTSLFFRAPVWPQQTCFNGCAPGTRADLTAMFGGEPTHDLGASYYALVNGVTYEPHEGPALRLIGDFWFDAGEVVVPPLTNSVVFPSVPFMFHGQVAGFAVSRWDDPLGPNAAFNLSLTGRGTASMRLVPDPDSGLWRYPEVYFRFEDQTPVPEPGSMLLLSGGLAALFARRRSSRRRSA